MESKWQVMEPKTRRPSSEPIPGLRGISTISLVSSNQLGYSQKARSEICSSPESVPGDMETELYQDMVPDMYQNILPELYQDIIVPELDFSLEYEADSNDGVLEDDTDYVCDILEHGADMLRNKYAPKIAYIFEGFLKRQQARVEVCYGKELRKHFKAFHTEKLNLQEEHRSQLLRYEQMVYKLRRALDKIASQSTQVKDIKEAELEELREALKRSKEMAQNEIDKRIQMCKAECEEEKVILQRDHAQSVQHLMHKSSEQLRRLEVEQQQQLTLKDQMITDFKNQIFSINQRVSDLEKEKNDERNNANSDILTVTKDKDILVQQVSELKKRLTQLHQEKHDLVSRHSHIVMQVRSETKSNLMNLKCQLSTTHERGEMTRIEMEGKIQDLEASLRQCQLQCQQKTLNGEEVWRGKLKHSEDQHSSSLESIKGHYKKQICNQKEIIATLQQELQNKMCEVDRLDVRCRFQQLHLNSCCKEETDDEDRKKWKQVELDVLSSKSDKSWHIKRYLSDEHIERRVEEISNQISPRKLNYSFNGEDLPKTNPYSHWRCQQMMTKYTQSKLRDLKILSKLEDDLAKVLI